VNASAWTTGHEKTDTLYRPQSEKAYEVSTTILAAFDTIQAAVRSPAAKKSHPSLPAGGLLRQTGVQND
jgi:hypothetical protein